MDEVAGPSTGAAAAAGPAPQLVAGGPSAPAAQGGWEWVGSASAAAGPASKEPEVQGHGVSPFSFSWVPVQAPLGLAALAPAPFGSAARASSSGSATNLPVTPAASSAAADGGLPALGTSASVAAAGLPAPAGPPGTNGYELEFALGLEDAGLESLGLDLGTLLPELGPDADLLTHLEAQGSLAGTAGAGELLLQGWAGAEVMGEAPGENEAAAGGCGGHAQGSGRGRGTGRSQLQRDPTPQQRANRRAAQKRCRAKQKAHMKGLEEGVAAARADLTRERAQRESAGLANAVMEKMLACKEEVVAALAEAGRAEAQAPASQDAEAAEEPSPDLAGLLQSLEIASLQDLDAMRRYEPAGHRVLGPDGSLTAPPFEKVLEDYVAIVSRLRSHLEGARQAGQAVVQRLGPEALRGMEASAAARDTGAADASAEEEPRALLQQSAVLDTDIVQASLAGRREGGAQSTEEDEEYIRFVHAALAADADARGLPKVVLVDGGVGCQQRDGPYFFPADKLRGVTQHFVKRLGTLLWQQAMFAPRNIHLLATTHLDSGEPLAEEDQDLDRWEEVLDQLNLTTRQMRDLLWLYHNYLDQARPAWKRRQAVLKEIAQLYSKGSLGGTAQAAAQRALALAALGDKLQQTALTEHAAYAWLTVGLVRLMTFPFQKFQLFVASYPAFPQWHLLAAAAERKLGLPPTVAI